MQRLWKGVGVMKFKVGDKVRVPGDPSGGWRVIEEERKTYGAMMYWAADDWYEEYELEPIEDPLVTKIEERNNKPVKMISGENLLNDNDPIKPSHYKTGDKDLFDELYDRLYHSKKMFIGREVFIIVMKFVAERYTRRYPNKNAEDLSKGIYTLERLKEYEEIENEK